MERSQNTTVWKEKGRCCGMLDHWKIEMIFVSRHMVEIRVLWCGWFFIVWRKSAFDIVVIRCVFYLEFRSTKFSTLGERWVRISLALGTTWLSQSMSWSSVLGDYWVQLNLIDEPNLHGYSNIGTGVWFRMVASLLSFLNNFRLCFVKIMPTPQYYNNT